MTSDPTTIGPEAKIWEAANMMLDRHISGLPVVGEDGHLLGIISESDFLRRGRFIPTPVTGCGGRCFPRAAHWPKTMPRPSVRTWAR
ncbi:CBS domain-containing protein (plasmid) [Agrobacterium vitis]